MATSNCTLGNRFAESKILAKTRFHSTAPLSTESSPPGFPPLFDTQIAELIETLRKHMNACVTPAHVYCEAPVQKQSRLVRNSALHKSWEVEYLVKEIRLLLDPDALHPAVHDPIKQQPHQHQTAKSP